MANTQIYCSHCGSLANSDALFCPSCGARISQPASAQQQNTQAAAPNKKRGGVLKVAAVAAAGVLAFHAVKSIVEERNQPPTQEAHVSSVSPTRKSDQGATRASADSQPESVSREPAVANGRIVSVNRPLRLTCEDDLSYQAVRLLEYYGKDAEAHALPADVNVTIDGDHVTFHIPVIAGYKYVIPELSHNFTDFRDALTLEGTVFETGEGIASGADNEDVWRQYGEPRFYYSLGTIDTDTSFTLSWTDNDTGNREIISIMNTNSYHGEGEEAEYFSRFALFYYPDYDRFQLYISLVAQKTASRHYRDGDDVLNFGDYYLKHQIVFGSDFHFWGGDTTHNTFWWY